MRTINHICNRAHISFPFLYCMLLSAPISAVFLILNKKIGQTGGTFPSFMYTLVKQNPALINQHFSLEFLTTFFILTITTYRKNNMGYALPFCKLWKNLLSTTQHYTPGCGSEKKKASDHRFFWSTELLRGRITSISERAAAKLSWRILKLHPGLQSLINFSHLRKETLLKFGLKSAVLT